VTGGAGFIGSHLVDHLVDAGHEVVVLDNFSTGKIRNLAHSLGHRNFRFVRADIRRLPRSLLKNLKKVDTVCHLAAVTSVPESVINPVFTTEVNVIGTLNVLETAKALKAERVVFSSSSAVYGTPLAYPIPETASISPISPYGASKAASELYLGSFEENYGIETVSLRYFNVYGPRQRPGEYAGVISIFGRKALQHQPLQIYGDGSQTRDFIYVSDVVDATIAATERTLKRRVFNIASGHETSILELGRAIQKIVKSHSNLKFCPARTGEVARSVADTSRARKELRLVGGTKLDDGLSMTIKWLARKADSSQLFP
jgi:UDP-glucose 4-epimerase